MRPREDSFSRLQWWDVTRGTTQQITQWPGIEIRIALETRALRPNEELHDKVCQFELADIKYVQHVLTLFYLLIRMLQKSHYQMHRTAFNDGGILRGVENET